MEPLLCARHGAANEGPACGPDRLASQRRQIGLTTFLTRVLACPVRRRVPCGLWAVGCGLCVGWSSVFSDSCRAGRGVGCLFAVFDGRPGLLLLDRFAQSKIMEPRAVGYCVCADLLFRSGPLVGTGHDMVGTVARGRTFLFFSLFRFEQVGCWFASFHQNLDFW